MINKNLLLFQGLPQEARCPEGAEAEGSRQKSWWILLQDDQLQNDCETIL